ncbi:hypothetical protein FIBSPDRAFT_970113 [Athelia psychrophila]|nr:hypothetical protein FIBSPDRAFT_970113 [Fibularhizoctonia sp. CBS 109695]
MRCLHMIMIVFLPIWTLSWAVLMPVHAFNISVVDKSGIDIFILSNVATDKQEWYAAHSRVENTLLKMAIKIRRKQLKKPGSASLSTPPNNDSDGAVDPLTRPSHDHDHQQTHDQVQNPEAQAKLRMLASYAATFALIIFGAIPVVFIGIISNVEALCKKESWLAWLCKVPSVERGVGLDRGLEGIPTRTGLELSLMTRYFMFFVVHSFLIMSLSSGIIMSLPQIVEDPSSIPTLLRQEPPAGGLTGFPMAVTPILHYINLNLFGSTPRSIYGLKYGALRRVRDALPRDDLPPRHRSGVQHHRASDQRPCTRVLRVLLPPPIPPPPGPRAARLLQYWRALLPQGDQPHLGQALCAAVLLAKLFFLTMKGTPTPIPEGALMIVLIMVTAIFQSMINNS